MKAKFVRLLLIVWPCSCLCLAASPPIPAQEPKPAAKTPDIEGTWNLVSWQRNGKDQQLAMVRIFITDCWIYSEGMALPNDKSGSSSTWHYHLLPGDRPSVAIMNLSGCQGRDLVPGIC